MMLRAELPVQRNKTVKRSAMMWLGVSRRVVNNAPAREYLTGRRGQLMVGTNNYASHRTSGSRTGDARP